MAGAATRVDPVVAWPGCTGRAAGWKRAAIGVRSARGAGGALPPLPSPLPAGCTGADDAVRWRRAGARRAIRCLPGNRPKATMAAGVCAPGVASSHDVTGHVVGVGIEPTTDGIRIRCSTLLSYPVVNRAESNRVPANRRLPPAGDPGDGMSATSGIRHGNAARTSPCLKRDRWIIEGAGHRHYRRAIMFGCNADNSQALPCARRNSSGVAGKPESVCGGLPRGVQFWHRGSLCRRKRKRPRDMRSEGVVKPRRSGWPISAGRVSGRCQQVFLAERARQHVHAQAWQQFGDGDGMRVQGKFPVVVATRCAR